MEVQFEVGEKLWNFVGQNVYEAHTRIGTIIKHPFTEYKSLCLCVQTQQITPQLALQVLLQFDKAINTALANRVRNRVNFRVSADL